MKLLSRLRSLVQAQGLAGPVFSVYSRVAHPSAKCTEKCRSALSGKQGVEIGGLSSMFTAGGTLPIYPALGSLDNWNPYATHSILRQCPGSDVKIDGLELGSVPDNSVQFILSCHSLEHIANPLKALKEWKRILVPEGYLLLVLPHGDATFDHRRKKTPFEHLLHDYEVNTGEDDQTHMHEFEQYDFTGPGWSADFMPPGYGLKHNHELRERFKDNAKWRYMHQHVFDSRLACKCVDFAGFQICEAEPARPFHIIVLAQKTNRAIDNNVYLGTQYPPFSRSPFKSDR
jgi:SAM-dependent methyltransferase